MRDAAECTKEAALIGASTRSQNDRIGTQGAELSTFEDRHGTGLTLTIRASTPHAALLLQEFLDRFERMQMADADVIRFPNQRINAGFGKPTTQSWPICLAEIRDLVAAHGGNDTVLTDSNGKTCRIEFFTEERTEPNG